MTAVRFIAALILAISLSRPVTAQPAPPTPRAATEVGIPAPEQGRALTATDLEAWLDGFMPYSLERGGIPGAVVAVVKDGRLLLAKGYGFADAEKRAPVVAERTLFRPGSIAKLFTWTAVMQLVDEGRLDLDRDINAYLDFRIPARADGPITLRHLMTHSPGFEEAVKGLIHSDPSRIEPLGTTLKRWTPTRVYPAGTTPAYSNYGTALAG